MLQNPAPEKNSSGIPAILETSHHLHPCPVDGDLSYGLEFPPPSNPRPQKVDLIFDYQLVGIELRPEPLTYFQYLWSLDDSMF